MKNEESRGFDVFFVFGREEKSSKIVQAKHRTLEVSFIIIIIIIILVERVLRAFYSPETFFEAVVLVGLPAALQGPLALK